MKIGTFVLLAGLVGCQSISKLWEKEKGPHTIMTITHPQEALRMQADIKCDGKGYEVLEKSPSPSTVKDPVKWAYYWVIECKD